ncbi:hypothetical protein CLOSTMETH_02575 [[Clostridium] methylpentosum DSM 5476]|uniref:Uncharacterized protein n=1 Tax=[Clostridium] methylpentosum DSM 5476 TaxID=537013 RepID=C0EFD3_9FIRM|nr:hypothetical protein CLOSTMETH_02575 [[Clostridium] methylpentosum DSM 5476]
MIRYSCLHFFNRAAASWHSCIPSCGRGKTPASLSALFRILLPLEYDSWLCFICMTVKCRQSSCRSAGLSAKHYCSLFK